MDKKNTVQESLHKRLHAVFGNDRKKMFPFLRLALGKTPRSTKALLELSDDEAKQVLSLLNFFVRELDDSYKMNEVQGELHRNFLWKKADKENLRILYFMRRGLSAGDIARKMEVSNELISQIQYQMLAAGATLGRFSHIETMIAQHVSEDKETRELLSRTYDEDIKVFAAKIAYKRKNYETNLCWHLAAYYAREMLAKITFGGNFTQKELAI